MYKDISIQFLGSSCFDPRPSGKTTPGLVRRPFRDRPSAWSSVKLVIFWIRNGLEKIPEFSDLCFPECIARVPVSLWGSGGWGYVRSTLRLRPQPFTTVRNRPQPSAWGPYGRAYGKFCKRGHLWRFPASRSFVAHGMRGTSWHSDVFRRCVAFFVAGATLWRPSWSFCVAAAAL